MKYRAKHETPFDEVMRLLYQYGQMALFYASTGNRKWPFGLCTSIKDAMNDMVDGITRKKIRTLLKLLRQFDHMMHWPDPPTPEEQRAIENQIGRAHV